MQIRMTYWFAAVLLAATTMAGDVGITYVKTLGQTNVRGEPLVTAGGRVAMDGDDNLYCGTPGGRSTLQKLAPDGRVIWSQFRNTPGFQGTAVDDDYVYTCGSGYYGARQVQRWRRSDGEAAPGWQFYWSDRVTSVNGVRPMLEPVALLVDEHYLYVADRAGDELRRLDKATGAEAPFGKRVMVVKPTDLAWGLDGRLLILTPESVLETDREGRPTRVPLVDGLHGAVALDYAPREHRLYIAEGGSAANPINLVRQFDADGKQTGNDIGVGGDFQGTWSPLGFAFNGGTGDILADGAGGLWINPGWDGKLGALPTLTHIGPAGKADRTLRGVSGNGLTMDDSLAVYLGGQFKLSWDNQVPWTSGLTSGGDTKSFPATHPHWFTSPVWHDSHLYISNGPGRIVFALNPATGGIEAGPQPITAHKGLLMPQSVGGHLLVGDVGGSLWQLDPELTAPPEKIFTAPEGWTVTGMLATADLRTFFVGRAGKPNTLAALTPEGKLLWETPGGPPLGWHDGLLFASGGPGLQVLEAGSGRVLATIDATTTDGRQPLRDIKGVAVGSRDGDTYLSVLADMQVRIYRLRRP